MNVFTFFSWVHKKVPFVAKFFILLWYSSLRHRKCISIHSNELSVNSCVSNAIVWSSITKKKFPILIIYYCCYGSNALNSLTFHDLNPRRGKKTVSKCINKCFVKWVTIWTNKQVQHKQQYNVVKSKRKTETEDAEAAAAQISCWYARLSGSVHRFFFIRNFHIRTKD